VTTVVCLRLAAVAVAVAATVGAASPGNIRVDDWDAHPLGPLELGKRWRTYPFFERGVFKQAPAIVEADGRHALRLISDGEAVRVGRAIKVDVRRTPWLVWDWKPLVLPERGDVRDRGLNDQSARVMVIFEGMKAVAYLWDTTAPVGTEVQPDELEMFQRSLVVVRSGPSGIGQWDSQRRDVGADYRRAFGEEPGSVTWVGFETHSNDTRTRSAALFGSASFEGP
jgi:hypothetical protein